LKGRTLLAEDDHLLQSLKRKHIANLSAPRTFSLNNHGFFQIQGLMALIYFGDLTAHRAEHAYAIERMEALVDSQYHQSGVHLEHSPHYHIFTTNTLAAVLASGWYSESGWLENRLANAKAATLWLVDPRCRPVCVGYSILTEQKALVGGPTGVTQSDGFLTSAFDEIAAGCRSGSAGSGGRGARQTSRRRPRRPC